MTFPKSGMMRNGNVYQAPHLECSSVGKEYILLPTPATSHYKGSIRGRYFGSKSYKSNLPEFIRDGFDDPIYPNPELYEVLMTFPTSWTELKPAGML
nr:hypothetical protein [Pontibacter mucosus]